MCLPSKSVSTDIVFSTPWCHEVYHLLESNQSQYSILKKSIHIRNETYDKCVLWFPDRGSMGTYDVLHYHRSSASEVWKRYCSPRISLLRRTNSDVVRSSNFCLFYVEVSRRTLDVDEQWQLRGHNDETRVQKTETFDSVHIELFFGSSHILNISTLSCSFVIRYERLVNDLNSNPSMMKDSSISSRLIAILRGIP